MRTSEGIEFIFSIRNIFISAKSSNVNIYPSPGGSPTTRSRTTTMPPRHAFANNIT